MARRTRCLRFAGRVAPPPRKTRFRPLAKLYRVGLASHRVPVKGFGDASYITSSFPRLRLAQHFISDTATLFPRTFQFVEMRGLDSAGSLYATKPTPAA